MPKDLRDPKALGERFLAYCDTLRGDSRFARARASEIMDAVPLSVKPYSANPTCIEKYGRPQDLPPCPF